MISYFIQLQILQIKQILFRGRILQLRCRRIQMEFRIPHSTFSIPHSINPNNLHNPLNGFQPDNQLLQGIHIGDL